MSFEPILAPSSVIEELKFQSPKSRVSIWKMTFLKLKLPRLTRKYLYFFCGTPCTFEYDLRNIFFNKIQIVSLQVELHVHLDGSMRRETLWELLKQKNLPLPGDGSFRAFEKAVSVQKPKDLGHFLSAFPIFLPAIK